MNPNEKPASRTSTTAVASLACGILGCIPFGTGLAAVILGIVGIRKTRDPRVSGKTLAIAGLVLGCLSLVGWSVGSVAILGGIIGVFKASAPARQVAEGFTRDLSKGDVDAALDKIVDGTDRQAMVAQAEKMKGWGELKAFATNRIDVQPYNGTREFHLGGLAVFASANKRFSMILRQSGTTYKLVKFDYQD